MLELQVSDNRLENELFKSVYEKLRIMLKI